MICGWACRWCAGEGAGRRDCYAAAAEPAFASPPLSAAVENGAREGTADLPSEDEVSDILRVVALVDMFRREGHLVARLDPLSRVRYGPWMSDTLSHHASHWCAVSQSG
jgi:2-oxoglutarate dehydrogenase complex dehydrogenase (E1) component-like enzyme